jgi:hypothetical protein
MDGETAAGKEVFTELNAWSPLEGMRLLDRLQLYAVKMMQIRIKSGDGARKSIANCHKVTYNEWFFSEL